MSRTNTQWILVKRPVGALSDDCFEMRESPIPELVDGQFLVRNRLLSCDPAQRGRIEVDTYVPKLPLGSVMDCGAVGEVVESKNPDHPVGQRVQGSFGWQQYCVSQGEGRWPPRPVPDGVSDEQALNVLGMTGMTAYFGLTRIAEIKAGQTLLVSGAAGATGSMVVQIGKIFGARVIGIAGGAHKTDFLTAQLGADAVIDYKSEDVAARLADLAPNGIDVYWDNVGGPILEAVLNCLAIGARIVICGAISSLDTVTGREFGPRNYTQLIIRRARMEGFIVGDFIAEAPLAIRQLAEWAAAGKVQGHVDVFDGLEQAPAALRGLFAGNNLGKRLVRL